MFKQKIRTLIASKIKLKKNVIKRNYVTARSSILDVPENLLAGFIWRCLQPFIIYVIAFQ